MKRTDLTDSVPERMDGIIEKGLRRHGDMPVVLAAVSWPGFSASSSKSDVSSYRPHRGSGLRVATLWGLDAVMTGRLSFEGAGRQVAEAVFDRTPGLAWLDTQGGGWAA